MILALGDDLFPIFVDAGVPSRGIRLGATGAKVTAAKPTTRPTARPIRREVLIVTPRILQAARSMGSKYLAGQSLTWLLAHRVERVMLVRTGKGFNVMVRFRGEAQGTKPASRVMLWAHGGKKRELASAMNLWRLFVAAKQTAAKDPASVPVVPVVASDGTPTGAVAPAPSAPVPAVAPALAVTPPSVAAEASTVSVSVSPPPAPTAAPPTTATEEAHAEEKTQDTAIPPDQAAAAEDAVITAGVGSGGAGGGAKWLGIAAAAALGIWWLTKRKAA